MAKYYPDVNIRLVGSEWFKTNLKACKALEPILAKRVQKQVKLIFFFVLLCGIDYICSNE